MVLKHQSTPSASSNSFLANSLEKNSSIISPEMKLSCAVQSLISAKPFSLITWPSAFSHASYRLNQYQLFHGISLCPRPPRREHCDLPSGMSFQHHQECHFGSRRHGVGTVTAQSSTSAVITIYLSSGIIYLLCLITTGCSCSFLSGSWFWFRLLTELQG